MKKITIPFSNIIKFICVIALVFSFSLSAHAANTLSAQNKPKSIVYKYFDFKLPKKDYRYEVLPYSEECECTEIDMFPTFDLNKKSFVAVFGVYKDEIGTKYSTANKLKIIKNGGGSVKLINGNRWWYQKDKNGVESYSYELGHASIGYRILIVPDRNIDSAIIKRLNKDVQKVIKSVKIIQKKPTELP